MTATVTTDHWLTELCTSPQVSAVARAIDKHGRLVAQGSFGSSTTMLAGALAAELDRPVVYVVAHLDEADDAAEDLLLFARRGMPLPVHRFDALEVLPGESNISLELVAQRFGVIGEIIDKRQAGQPVSGIFVTPIQALMQAVPHPNTLDRYQFVIGVGQQIPPARLLDWLDRAGYQRADVIEQPGDFATRGGIIDIYPPAGSLSVHRDNTGSAKTSADGAADGAAFGPIRLDYFGDEIDSICRIDTQTMGSGQALEQVTMIGASAQQLQSDDDTTHFLSLLGDDTIVVMHEVMELSEQARGYYERLTNARGIYPPKAIFEQLKARPHVEVNQYSASAVTDVKMMLPVGQLMSFDQNAAAAVKELAALAAPQMGRRVTVWCNNEAERDRLVELFAEHAPGSKDVVDIEIGYLHRGFVWRATDEGESESADASSPDDSPAHYLVPHHELFHRYETRRRIRKVAIDAGGEGSGAFLDLDVGDYVVHIEHGIARFSQLKTMTRHGKTEEYLTLEFAKGSLLHVPAAQIALVQRYVGGFSGKPPLSMLGGKRWARQKEAVEEAVKDMAAELLRVQAARAALPGVRYPADSAWQGEFEAEFPYQETEDQLAAIARVKSDMGDEQPMDRLICGDVGFGKTEVAIRAAFKAVEHGKQVAVLVPTTVLAEQHDRTFGDRMADYPIRIETISRFKSPMQQRKVLKALAQGQVDIIVGTHRLLSKDVHFADLGLVIVDEEQRFGVEHKQRLLEFRLTADVLTLTATPIPRTLHMAMLGLRDISSLSTAPPDRRSIVTDVAPFNKDHIKQAIIRELNRDGQVFFVHNRVHNIQSMADDIRQLVPDAKVLVGHGQMSAGELEQVMLTFTRRRADVLVCTTIIESGIDIPTANTIFINQADHFGLADLHQLRGRVGRYKHRAYCYLLLPDDRPITDMAAKRLKALEQYSMLGAGFKIAMRDLEIRGAGNLLGAEQSGHIAAVGYEMYCTLLDHAAKRMKNEPVVEPVYTHFELPVAGRLTRQYIASNKYRMEAYRRLSRAASFEQLEKVVGDLVDAYGPAPESVQTLLDLTELRIAASLLQIESLKLDGPDLIFRTRRPQSLEPVLKDGAGRTTVVDATTVYYRPPQNHLEPPQTLLAVLRKMLLEPARGISATVTS